MQFAEADASWLGLTRIPLELYPVALIGYYILFRAFCREAAVKVVKGIAVTPDCRLGFSSTLDVGYGTGQCDTIPDIDTPDAKETKSIVAGIPNGKRKPKRLGVNDAIGP